MIHARVCTITKKSIGIVSSGIPQKFIVTFMKIVNVFLDIDVYLSRSIPRYPASLCTKQMKLYTTSSWWPLMVSLSVASFLLETQAAFSKAEEEFVTSLVVNIISIIQ